jgi:hypothetical protein
MDSTTRSMGSRRRRSSSSRGQQEVIRCTQYRYKTLKTVRNCSKEGSRYGAGRVEVLARAFRV